MPSKSAAQAKLMAAAAHNPAFARKVGIKQSVAQEWHHRDKAKSGLRFAGKIKRQNR